MSGRPAAALFRRGVRWILRHPRHAPSAGLLLALLLSAAVTPAHAADRRWRPVDYSYNFINTYIPTAQKIGTMGIKGFLSLWGILSFLETHLPEGLDGRRYVVAIRDLRTAIDLYKKDMLYLVYELIGARPIDREVLKVQIFDISQQLQVIVSTLQYVRRSLLKAAYYLFAQSIRNDVLQRNDYRFSATLNYLGTDNPWRGWLDPEDLHREIGVARELGLDLVKINVFLDYWVFNRPKVRREVEATIAEIRAAGLGLFLSCDGINAYFPLDLTFADRAGRPIGAVNWMTWKYQAVRGCLDVIGRFKPDYATVLRNPFVDPQEQVNQKVTAAEWLAYVEEVADGVRAVSPDTRVVVEIPLAGEREVDFLRSIDRSTRENLVLGFMIYSIKDFFSVGNFLVASPPKKPVVIAEYWDSVGLYIDDLAEEFLRLGYLWSLDKGVKVFNVSFSINLHTPLFEKTPAYFVYRDLITRGAVIGESREGVKSGMDAFHGRLEWRGRAIPLSTALPVGRGR